MRLPSVKAVIQISAIVLVLGVAVAIAVALVKTRPEPERKDEQKPGVLVDVVAARAEQVSMNVTGTGALEARTELQLTSQVGGRIDYLSPALRRGAAFREGDLLLKIDQRRYRLAVQSARATLEQLAVEKKNDEESLGIAKRQAALYDNEYERAQKLVETQTGSKSARDQARVQMLGARQTVQTLENKLRLYPDRLKSAEAALEGAQVNLDDTEVHAPFDGRTSALMVERGHYISPGTPLAEVYAEGPMEVTIRVPLDQFLWVDTSNLEKNPPRAEARLKMAGQHWTWTGKVVRTDSIMDSATRTAGLTVALDASQKPRLPTMAGGESPAALTPAPELVPGLFLDVEVQGRTVPRVYPVPLTALDQEGRAYVALPDDRLDIRPVTVLAKRGDIAYVSDGLTDADRLIVSPMSAPVDGMRIRLPVQKGPSLRTSAEAAAPPEGASE